MTEEIIENEVSEIDTEEQERIEHENFLKSFPESTVFYDRIFEEENVKRLGAWIKDPYVAERLKMLDNHIDESELSWRINPKTGSGTWYLKGYEDSEPTVEELKVKKLAEISAEAHKYSQYECEDMYLTSSKGFRINADRKAQDNLKGLIGIGVTCRFKDYDNEFHPGITVEDLNLMLLECYQNGALMYQKKFEYEDMVANAKSREDLDFDVVFDMADFSKS